MGNGCVEGTLTITTGTLMSRSKPYGRNHEMGFVKNWCAYGKERKFGLADLKWKWGRVKNPNGAPRARGSRVWVHSAEYPRDENRRLGMEWFSIGLLYDWRNLGPIETCDDTADADGECWKTACVGFTPLKAIGLETWASRFINVDEDTWMN